MKVSQQMGMGLLAALILGALPKPACAERLEVNPKGKNVESRYQKPEDLLDMVPFLGEIPRSFLFGNGFKMKFNLQSLRIDHMGYRSSTAKNARDCMIGFSYSTPVAGFFTSRVDLPLLHAATPNPTDWKMSGMGDYTAYFSRGAISGPSLRLVVSAKF